MAPRKQKRPSEYLKDVKIEPELPKGITGNTYDENLLLKIVEATKVSGFMYVEPATVSVLVRGGLVELNLEYTEGEKVACRATEKGLSYFHTETKTETVAEKPQEEPKMNADTAYAIDDNVPMPAPKPRGGGKGRAVIYPFEQLQLKQSFHIPATAESPNPAKARASLVTLWNNKFATTNGATETVKVKKYQLDHKGKRVKVDGHFIEVGEELVTRPVKSYSRKFAIVSVDETDPRGKGARIYRVA